MVAKMASALPEREGVVKHEQTGNNKNKLFMVINFEEVLSRLPLATDLFEVT